MNFKKWVKSIQTAGYNGARTVYYNHKFWGLKNYLWKLSWPAYPLWIIFWGAEQLRSNKRRLLESATHYKEGSKKFQVISCRSIETWVMSKGHLAIIWLSVSLPLTIFIAIFLSSFANTRAVCRPFNCLPWSFHSNHLVILLPSFGYIPAIQWAFAGCPLAIIVPLYGHPLAFP